MPINPVINASRKPIRLPAAAYREAGSSWFVTIGCASRFQAFAEPAMANSVATTFKERACALDVELHLWCLMPDHVHLIVEMREGGAGLVDFLQDVKGRSTRLWWANGGTGPLWQRSFHDRGVRGPKAFDAAVRYTLTNPIESGLVADWADYPWLGGSLIGDKPPSPRPSSCS